MEEDYFRNYRYKRLDTVCFPDAGQTVRTGIFRVYCARINAR